MKTIIATTVLTLLSAAAGISDPVRVQVRSAPMLSMGAWVNSEPLTVTGDTGKVRVVLFWTRDCINCKHNLPYWEAWSREYKHSNVQIVSVHTPETDSERSLNELRRFVADRHLTFPVVTDNHFKTWNAFGIQSWPTEILIDKHGRIRYEFDGELNWNGSGEYQTVHQAIEGLRHEV